MPKGSNLTNEDKSKGGQSQGPQNNPANFANDPQRASEEGQKGGEATQQDSDQTEEDQNTDGNAS